MTNLVAIALATNVAGQVFTTTWTNTVIRQDRHAGATSDLRFYQVTQRHTSNALVLDWHGLKMESHVETTNLARAPFQLGPGTAFKILPDDTVLLITNTTPAAPQNPATNPPAFPPPASH